MVGEVVVGDAEQPGGKVRPGAKTLQAGKGLQERFLREILGSMLIASQLAEPAEESFPVALDERGEGLPVALLGSADQPIVLGRELWRVTSFWPCLLYTSPSPRD